MKTNFVNNATNETNEKQPCSFCKGKCFLNHADCRLQALLRASRSKPQQAKTASNMSSDWMDNNIDNNDNNNKQINNKNNNNNNNINNNINNECWCQCHPCRAKNGILECEVVDWITSRVKPRPGEVPNSQEQGPNL
ncbi:unnamed protein product [Polarella glacialis]|uniref:Uncharacterized protein n=1 Tax=Polarella glacialis TaxID=89957 RepID=A0A813DB98_POLGL|nr:unnamed protein product [Polarella glacialis]